MTRHINSAALSGPILPKSTRMLLDASTQAFPLSRRHPGLQLDKFAEFRLDESDGKMMAQQRDALRNVTKTSGDSNLLKELLNRRHAVLSTLGARILEMTAARPLTLHLSRAGTWENAGICLHPVYGFVFLPGSGVKGLIRSWAETVWAKAQPDPDAAWRRIEELFGYSPQSEIHKFARPKEGCPGWRPKSIPSRDGSAAGRLVFHDAWPAAWPRLEVDVVNNHHPDYYQGKGNPGDWENPNLVYFLSACGDTAFEFAISDRKPRNDDALDLATGWLYDALSAEGAGAKTASGYGRFIAAKGARLDVPAALASKEYKLQLVSPAFLAGAEQSSADCDLRPATLRGLLRWWWRAMYASKVDPKTLRALETVVWGDAEHGSRVRIAVRIDAGDAPRRYHKKSVQFLREHGIPQRSHQKVTLGLYYASYGMAEKEPVRWYRPEGSRWQIVLTARDGEFRKASGQTIPLAAKDLLFQACVSLWLLAKYGGAGSKSRKGFGSFQEFEVRGISSIQDCSNAAERFLGICNLPVRPDSSDYAPALDKAIIMDDLATAWDDPWFAIHEIGEALQSAAKGLDKQARIALGLPRFGHADRQYAGGLTRHASPVFWSLARSGDVALTVRLIAFPSPRLPNWQRSNRILRDFVADAKAELEARLARRPNAGTHYPRKADPSPSKPNQASQNSGYPKVGTRVDVELLEERTTKGRWKARHLGSGLVGPVQDDIPDEVAPGQQINLLVHSINAVTGQIAFRWEAQGKKGKPAARESGRGNYRKQGKKRRR